MRTRDAMLPAVTAALGLWLAAQTALALTLRVEGYDGYWYLSNAWYLVGGPVSSYEITKAPLLSLLILPLAALRRLGAPELLAFVGSHLLAVLLTLAAGLLLGKLLGSRFSPPVAWAGVFAFLASRIVCRYGAFAMSDLPATLFVLAGLMAVHRARYRPGWRARGPFALAAAAAVLARYPSALVIPVAVLWDAAQAARHAGPAAGARRAAALRRLGAHAGGGLVTLAVIATVHLAVYAVPFGGPTGALAALGEMVARNARLGGISVRGLEPWWEYGPVLVRACTAPLVLLAAVGVAVALRRGSSMEWLHALWMAAHLGFISAISSHKEARYLLPALPSLYLFALWGLSAAGRAATSLLDRAVAGGRTPEPGPAPWPARAGAVVLLLGTGLLTLFQEGRMLAQPFFRTPHVSRLMSRVEQRVPPPARLAWAGNFYPLRPPRYVFDPRDEYYYVYHLAPHVLEYASGRPVTSLRGLPGVVLDGTLYPVGAATWLGDGDGLFSSVPGITVTANLQEEIPPLVLSTVRAWDLVRLPQEKMNSLAWSHAADPVSARPAADGEAPAGGEAARALTLTGFPGPTEVVVRRRDGSTLSLGLVGLAGGSAHLPLPAGWTAGDVAGLRIVRYAGAPVQVAW